MQFPSHRGGHKGMTQGAAMEKGWGGVKRARARRAKEESIGLQKTAVEESSIEGHNWGGKD